MIRPLVAGVLAALAVILFAYFWLALTPVRAAGCEPMAASWYGAESGNRTASGEPFDGRSLTAAHRTLPFGTRLRVSYGSRSVVVRVNDRGPYVGGRALDLSRAAAAKLGMIEAGVARVCVTRE